MSTVPEAQDAKLARRTGEDRLGKDIIDECRVQLMLRFRFLDLALWRMDLVPLRAGAAYPLATDGSQVVYDPPRVIARFQESFDESVRDYLHLVMHCIFRHPYDKDHDSREAWGLACDILVESAVMDLCGDRFASADDAARREALDEMALLAGRLVPAKVYGLVRNVLRAPEGQQYRGLGSNALNEWRALFERDDHGAWPANSDVRGAGEGQETPENASPDDEHPDEGADAVRAEAEGGAEQDEGAGCGDGAQEGALGAPADGPDDEPPGDEAEDDGAGDGEPLRDARAGEPDAGDGERSGGKGPDEDEREWAEIAKQIETNLETFSREWGEEAGALLASLALANRPVGSYTDFLRRFMVMSEEMQLNKDEFDYVYYTYGLELYGNMPLVEPLEYREVERVRDFVVVIDTSESVSGELVRRFAEHTFDILKSSEDYASEVNIHLMQCDTRVQSDLKITSLSDVDRAMEGFQVRGFGGTDFRPAFDYVDSLREQGEFTHLKGLVYFTDGLGQFPEKAPDYEVAFVFMDEGEELPPVPPWACKILVDETGIERLAGGGRRAAAD